MQSSLPSHPRSHYQSEHLKGIPGNQVLGLVLLTIRPCFIELAGRKRTLKGLHIMILFAMKHTHGIWKGQPNTQDGRVQI